MPNEQLLAHIRSELARGADKTALIQSLLTAGWKVEDINAAMTAAAPAQEKPAVPTPAYHAPVAPAVSAKPVEEVQQGSAIKTLIQDAASGLFIGCVFILTIVSILGVWKFFSGDVITKSFQTLGLLAFVAMVVIVASKFVGDPSAVAMPNATFRAIRNITLGTLVVSAVLLAFFGVMSIWEVITDTGFLNKVLSSMAIIAFSSYITVLICLEREQNPFWKKRGGQMTGVGVIVTILFIWIFFALMRF